MLGYVLAMILNWLSQPWVLVFGKSKLYVQVQHGIVDDY
jgi:hypothetical protein